MDSPRLAAGMTLLSVVNVARSFGAVTALGGVSFHVDAGEAVAVIGPNGAGKTTCFNVLTGALRADAGEILFAGHSIDGLSPHAVARLGVGRTFQVAAVFPSMTARENVQVALAAHARRSFRWWTSLRRHYAAEADSLLDRVGLAGEADRPVAELAHGDGKRLDLAIALAQKPRLLLMDEPTAGVAAGERGRLMDLVDAIVREWGIGVLFTEHDLDVVFGHAARIIVLHRGVVVASGTVDDIRRDPNVQAVYLGTESLPDTVACSSSTI